MLPLPLQLVALALQQKALMWLQLETTVLDQQPVLLQQMLRLQSIQSAGEVAGPHGPFNYL